MLRDRLAHGLVGRAPALEGRDDGDFGRSGGRGPVPRPLLACARRRAGAVRRLPAAVQAARGPARAVLRPGAQRRPDGADHLRPLERLLHRSHREEAAQPLPARHAGPVVRHRRLQPDLQVLPELGHLEVAGVRPADRSGDAGGDRPRRRGQRLPQRRLHLQRSGDLPGVRRRRGAGLPGARASRRWR